MPKPTPENKACLICGTTKGPITRGLCPAHYLQFRRRMAKLSSAGKEQFEQRLVASGKLMHSQQGQRPDSQDAFEADFEQLVAEHPEFEYQAKPLDDPTPAEVLENARRKKKRSE